MSVLASKTVKNIIIPLLAVIGIFNVFVSFMKVLTDVTAMNVSVSAPKHFVCLPEDPEPAFTCTVSNRASLILPFFNPSYSVQIEISGTSAHFEDVDGKKHNLAESPYNIGYISPRDSKSLNFTLQLEGKNATFRMRTYLYLMGFKFEHISTTYSLVHYGDYNYTFRAPRFRTPRPWRW